MWKNLLFTAILVLAAFASGYLARGWSDTESGEKSGTAPLSQNPRMARAPKNQDPSAPPGKSAVRSEPQFTFNARQLEVILNMGMIDPLAIFGELGVAESQIRILGSIEFQSKMRDDIHALKIRHARLLEDEDGQYLEISPFPQERLRWMAEFEDEIRKIVDNGQAPLLARALIARFDWLDTGLYTQRIRSIRQRDGELDLRKTTYGSDGNFIREDVGRLTSEDREIWGRFLEIPEE